MLSKPLLPLAAFLLLAGAATGQARLHTAPGTKALGKRIARTAPLVFIGRPIIGGLHEDSVALYDVTYIDVVQVLRGDLRPGKVELLDTLPAMMYRTNPGMRQMARLGGTRGVMGGTLGIYFAQPSQPALATRLQASAERPVQLQGYERRPDANILLQPGKTTGLYRSWSSPRHVWKFLARLPDVQPVADALKK